MDPNGELVVGTPAKLGAPRKRAQLRDSALRAIETAKPVVSGPFRSPYVNEIDAQPIWVVAVNLPMTVKGEKTHVIRGIIRCAEFSDLLIGMKFPDRWIGLITDGNGTPIASSAQHGVTVGNTVGGKILDTDKNYQKINVGGIEYQSRKTLLDGPKWTVQVGIAADEDADASNVATLRITVFYCLMIVWMGSFGFFAARKIRRRLNLIVDLARDVSQRKIIKTSFSVIDEINEFQEALQKLSAEQQLLLEKSQKNESAPERRVV